MPPTHRSPPVPRRIRRDGERAFSIVEVLIAVLVLAIVASAVGFAAASGSRSRSMARLQSSLTTTGTKVQEDIATDRAWMATAPCKVLGSPCNVAGHVRSNSLDLDGMDGDAQLDRAEATPIDSPVDGVGSRDADGVVPDYYRLEIVIRPMPEVAARFSIRPETSIRRFVTSIDRRGMELVGSLEVEICRVTNQTDDRMNVQGCRSSGATNIGMAACPPVSRRGCPEAFAWASSRPASRTGPSAHVVLERVSPSGIAFTLRNTSTGETWRASDATRDGGNVVFQNLPAGEYRLDGLPATRGPNTERWKLKEVPTYHGSSSEPIAGSSVVVEPGLRNRALVLYRPKKTSGIDLYFQRRTRTYTLRGPFTKEETNVPEWAPTHRYIGASAAFWCGALASGMAGDSNHYRCTGIRMVGQNCAEALVSGHTYSMNPPGGWSTEPVGSSNYVADPDGPWTKNSFTNRRFAKGCTFYAEHYTHTYYSTTTPPTWRTRAGSAKAATYFVEPKPDSRFVEPGPAGMVAPIAQCVVQERAQCSPAIRPLATGLNSKMMIQSGDEANATVNQFFSGTPSWLVHRGLWVHPENGSITSSNGSTRPANPRVVLTGMGECYWRGPRLSGEIEGPCNPCTPLWRPGFIVTPGCSVLTKTHWERPAIEKTDIYDPVTGADIGGHPGNPLPTKSGDINYNPPWGCTTSAPVMKQGSITCRAVETGGGDVGIPETRHPSSSSGGTAIVNPVSFSPGAG